MENVPNIISTKDLAYIEDMLNWKFILIKKINNYIIEIEDKDLKKILEEAYKELLNSFNDYLTLLN